MYGLMTLEFLNVLALLAIVGTVAVAYSVRIVVKGRVHYDRVNRQGGSLLLGKGLMEMAYWALQPLSRVCISVGITPNQISWTSLVLGGIAGSCLAYGRFGTAALIAAISALLDSLDGMVARATGHASEGGEILDAAIDRYVEFFFLGGLVLYYQDTTILQVLSLLALMGSFMVSYSTAKAEAMQLPPPPGIMRRPERAFYLVLGAALSPFPIPGLPESLLGPHPIYIPMAIAVGFVAVLSNISAIERLYSVALTVSMRAQKKNRLRLNGSDSTTQAAEE